MVGSLIPASEGQQREPSASEPPRPQKVGESIDGSVDARNMPSDQSDATRGGERPESRPRSLRMPGDDGAEAVAWDRRADDALDQLQTPGVCLTGDTMRLLQWSVCDTLGREGRCAPGFYVLDPLFLQIDDERAPYPALPESSVIPSSRCLILPLYHTNPTRHWTLALIDLIVRRVDWYDPSPHQDRTDRVGFELPLWVCRESPGFTAFEFHAFQGPQPDDGSYGTCVLMALYYWLQGIRTPPDFDSAGARALIASFLRTGLAVRRPSGPALRFEAAAGRVRDNAAGGREMEQLPRSAKNQRLSEGSTPTVGHTPPNTGPAEVYGMLDELVLLESTIKMSIARIQGLPEQSRQPYTLPHVVAAEFYLTSLRRMMDDRRHLVELAMEGHRRATEDAQTARRISQSQATSPDTSMLSGQLTLGTARLLQEVEKAEEDAQAEVNWQREKEREISDKLALAQLAVELGRRREAILGAVYLFLDLVGGT